MSSWNDGPVPFTGASAATENTLAWPVENQIACPGDLAVTWPESAVSEVTKSRQLGSITQGQGSSHVTFHHYDRPPDDPKHSAAKADLTDYD